MPIRLRFNYSMMHDREFWILMILTTKEIEMPDDLKVLSGCKRIL
jgi:hypothetical protein